MPGFYNPPSFFTLQRHCMWHLHGVGLLNSCCQPPYGTLQDNELSQDPPERSVWPTLRGLHKYDLRELWKTYMYHTLLFPMSESNERIARGLVKHLLWGRNAGLHFGDNTCVKPYHQLSPFNASVDGLVSRCIRF